MIAYETTKSYNCGECEQLMRWEPLGSKKPVRYTLQCDNPSCPEHAVLYTAPIDWVQLSPFIPVESKIDRASAVRCDCAGARPFERLDEAPDDAGLMPHVCPCCGKRRMLAVAARKVELSVIEVPQ